MPKKIKLLSFEEWLVSKNKIEYERYKKQVKRENDMLNWYDMKSFRDYIYDKKHKNWKITFGYNLKNKVTKEKIKIETKIFETFNGFMEEKFYLSPSLVKRIKEAI